MIQKLRVVQDRQQEEHDKDEDDNDLRDLVGEGL